MRPTSPIIEILSKLQSFSECRFELFLPEKEDDYVDVGGTPSLFETQGVFDSCSDEDAVKVLRDFVRRETIVGYNLECELTKLLAARGVLIKEEIEPIIENQNWSLFTPYSSLLSYLIHMDDREQRIHRLLDVVLEDFRDGLLLACYKIDSARIDSDLIRKFVEWDKDINWTPTATGELMALGYFLKKWIRKYDIHRLEALLNIYFRHL